MVTIILSGFIVMFVVAGICISMEAKQATGGLALPGTSLGDHSTDSSTSGNE